MMNKEKIKILNCEFDNISRSQLIERFKSGILMPVNVDLLMKMQRDKAFYECTRKATFVINDSQIVKLASKLVGTPIKETIPGSDFFPYFYSYFKSDTDTRLFLLGAMDGVAEKAKSLINKKVNREIVVGCYSPPFGFEKDESECAKIVTIINNSGATVLAIGVGAPKQEKWVFKYQDKLPDVKKILCIGATIDFEAGNINRAPRMFRRFGFEWFYRLIKEPRRLWKRYIIDDIPFFILILRQYLKLYKNPFEER